MAEVEIPESLAKLAESKGWPLDLVKEVLDGGLPQQLLEAALNAGLTPEQARERMAARQAGQGGGGFGGPPPLDMSWSKAPTERGARPVIGEHGLTLGAINFGSYGFVPDHWPYENDTPRGAHPAADRGLPASYSIYEKVEVWADNCADLYEDAIRERWASATDIPWSTLEPLPDHIEQSICQLCTGWSEDALLGVETICKWLEHISYGYHEVKLYLATEVYELARHAEAFRKRALANGGGLGVEGTGYGHRVIASGLKFTEALLDLNVLRTSFTLTILERYGDAIARSEADRTLFQLVARDMRRHLAYGLEHLKYFVQMQPEKRSDVNAWLNRGEVMFAADLRFNTPAKEALILLLADTPKEGDARLAELRRHQVQDYLDRLASATITDRADQLPRNLHYYIEDREPAAAPSS
jgi:hypothetical protein